MRNVDSRSLVVSVSVGCLLLLAACGREPKSADVTPPSTHAPGAAESAPVSGQLQGGEWVVEDIDKQGIVDRSRGTLNFDAEGRVAGRSFCNQYNGSYTVSEGSLTVGRLVSTKMACPPAIMDLERRFADVLTHVTRFEMSADGALVLHTDDGRTMTARRE